MKSTTPAAIWSLLVSLHQKQRNFLVASAIVVTLNSASILVLAANSIMAARLVSAEQWGSAVLFNTGINTIALFADVVGVSFANVYLVASGKQVFPLTVVRGTILAYASFDGVVFGTICAFTPLRSVFFPGLNGTWASIIWLGVVSQVLINLMRSLAWGRSDFLAMGSIELARAIANLILVIIIGRGLGLRNGWYVAFAQVLSMLVAVPILLAYVSRGGMGRPAFGYLKLCLGVGSRAAFVNWLSLLHLRIDQYLISDLLGVAALGSYGVAVSLAEVVTRIPSMLGNILFPLTASANKTSQAALSTLKRAVVTMTITFVACLLLAVLADRVVRILYGAGYTASVPALRWLLPATVALSGLILLNNHLAGSGYPSILIYSMGLGLMVNIALNLFLLERWGIAGASFTSSVTYTIQLVLVVAYVIRQSKRKQ